MMKDLQRKRSSSLLMITHNLGIIAELCQKVAVIYAGTIIEYGTVKEVFTNPQHWYTKGLLGAIPKLTGPRNRLAFIPGNVANASDLPEGCKFHSRCLHCEEACQTQVPELFEYTPGHYVACWERRKKQ